MTASRVHAVTVRRDAATDGQLFSIPGECDSRLDLDSLDALELAFAIEEATGISQPRDLDYRELLTVDAVIATLRSAAMADNAPATNPDHEVWARKEVTR